MYEELAFISYSVAYDIFYKASPVSPLLAAVFALETFILYTLLHHFSRVKTSNVTTQPAGERLYTACNGALASRSKSFMVSINSIPNTHEAHGLFTELSNPSGLVMLVDKDDFLINLLWLLAYNSDIRDNASFLDLFLKNIPAETTDDDDDLQSFTLSSLTRIDAKVLLIGAAKWSELCTSHGQKCGASSLCTLPPLAFTQPSYMVLNFWKLLVSFTNKEMRDSRAIQLCSENGLIIAALEASRLRAEIPDVRIVDHIRKWLVVNGIALGDTKGNWIKLYSRTFMDLINGAHYGNQGVSTGDLFFPPLNDLDYDMFHDAEKRFSPQDFSAVYNCSNSPILDESSKLRQASILSSSRIESINDSSAKPKTFLQRICTSAKTILPSEYGNPITFACVSKNDGIRALELVGKDYERRCKNEISANLELNNLSSLTNENKVEENLYAEIVKMQNEHALDVCRLVQRINSLEETVKQSAGQYTTELAMYTSKAYKQGYNDGYYSALQASNTSMNLMRSMDQHPAITQVTDFLETQTRNTLDIGHSHNPKECIGCASEEEQDRLLRILDSLADSGVV
ncbi:unnamed protein product [Litomosoides sigmodontis]|uniref:Uncharacterized protein n=1 Tax=Litomosoides sigmodontis TaxID=42156 RepID=A0A3P6TVV2_LITSI|nr:unnamed protein product [Litomosoides sigmodontis]